MIPINVILLDELKKIKIKNLVNFFIISIFYIYYLLHTQTLSKAVVILNFLLKMFKMTQPNTLLKGLLQNMLLRIKSGPISLVLLLVYTMLSSLVETADVSLICDLTN